MLSLNWYHQANVGVATEGLEIYLNKLSEEVRCINWLETLGMTCLRIIRSIHEKGGPSAMEHIIIRSTDEEKASSSLRTNVDNGIEKKK